MNQSLHIFRKDILHLRPELTNYIGLVAILSLVAPQTWEGAALHGTMLALFSNVLKGLIPIAMLMIIARLIHDESLVGDRQFWVTRPYAWTSLLSAKLLFVIVCLVLPIVAMQWSLLLQAGLNPLASIPSLLSRLVSLALIPLLPFMAAAVTSTVGGAGLLVAAFVVVLIGVLTVVGSEAGSRMTPPFVDGTFSILFGGLLIGILLYQYATRNTSRTRIALVATAFLFFVFHCCFRMQYFAGPVNALIRYHYPVSTNAAERLTFDASLSAYQGQEGMERANGGFLSFLLPIHLEGFDPSARLHEANASFTLDVPGYHYTSPWRPVTVADRGLFLSLPADVFKRIHATEAHMHLSLVAQRLLPDTPQIVTVANHFSVPGGSCLLLADRPLGTPLCRYAFQSPLPTRVNGSVTAQFCNSSAPTHPGMAVMRVIPADGIDTVVEEPLLLGGNVCPGTQLTFQTYHPADNFRLELDIPAVALDHYYKVEIRR